MNPVQSSEALTGATVPRDYNFAADILKRNLDAGRANKTLSIIAANTTMPTLPTGSSVSVTCCARSGCAWKNAS